MVKKTVKRVSLTSFVASLTRRNSEDISQDIGLMNDAVANEFINELSNDGEMINALDITVRFKIKIRIKQGLGCRLFYIFYRQPQAHR
jgi:hypothetical protein